MPATQPQYSADTFGLFGHYMVDVAQRIVLGRQCASAATNIASIWPKL